MTMRIPAGARTQSIRGQVAAGNSPSIDAFDRWRVSNPATLFDAQQQYGFFSLLWEQQVAGTGALANQLARASLSLQTGGTASGARCTLQTKANFRYQPGKSQLIIVTFVLGAGVSNCRRRVGYYDADDGIFLQQLGTVLSLVRRTSTSGAPVDNAVAQTSWNLDKMDGTGPSGIKLDVTKSQILVIDLQWLGVGRVRVGFDIDGILYYAHEFKNANVLDVVYMSNPNLPVRAEIENTGVAGSTATLEFICCQVASEGGFEDQLGIQWSANRGATALGVTTRRPVLSIRAKTTGPNAKRNKGQILFRNADLIADDNSALVEIVLNGSLTGASFAAVDANLSIAERDTAASAIAGGQVVDSFYVPAASGVFGSSNANSGETSPYRRLPLVYSGLLSVQDVLSIVVTSVSGTSNINASMTWQELF